MIYLIAGILVIELIRLILSIQQDRQIRYLNNLAKERSAKAFELEKQQNEDWKQLRKMEIEELKELAQGSKILTDIINEFIDFSPKKEKESEGK
jgi:hypothetical protein